MLLHSNQHHLETSRPPCPASGPRRPPPALARAACAPRCWACRCSFSCRRQSGLLHQPDRTQVQVLAMTLIGTPSACVSLASSSATSSATAAAIARGHGKANTGSRELQKALGLKDLRSGKAHELLDLRRVNMRLWLACRALLRANKPALQFQRLSLAGLSAGAPFFSVAVHTLSSSSHALAHFESRPNLENQRFNRTSSRQQVMS